MLTAIIAISFIGLIILSIVLSVRAFKKGKNAKKIITAQVLSFVVAVAASSTASMATHAAEEKNTEVVASETAKSEEKSSSKGLGHIAMGLCMGLGSLGAGIAVAAAAPAAIGALSENPKTFGKSLVLVGLAEGVTIFAFIVSIMINTSLS